MPITSIIKYEGDNRTFIWKHPTEDFNTTSQLIVDESQEAIFVMNGQALDLFGPGRHTLTTQNIPLIRNIMSLPTGGETPFKCKVYFVNKTEQMAIRWGTDSKVQFLEPIYNFPLSIGASGEMSMKANDSRRLLVKLVGTEVMLGQQKLVEYFRSFIMTRVKTYLAQSIKEKKISIFEIDEHLNDLSEDLRLKISRDFAEYGIALETFFVTTEGAGNFSSAGIGLGIMTGVGGTIGSSVGGAFNEAMKPIANAGNQNQTPVSPDMDLFCDNCGTKATQGAVFCDECGQEILKQQNNCSNCGYVFEKPGKFCPKCGTKREGQL